MGLVVFWSQFAELKLKEIFEYYRANASNSVAFKITDGIINQTLYLNENPEIGQKEIYLEEATRTFRYLIFTKITKYYII